MSDDAAASQPDGDDPFCHPAVFYRGVTDYLDAVVPFLADGVTAGEPVAVAVPGPNLLALRTELAARVGELADRVRWLDMTDAGRNPGRIIPGVLRAFADQYDGRPVRIVGEPIWPDRSDEEYPACAQHEALINAAFAGRKATILCPYDALGLDPVRLADAEVTHPVLVHGGVWTSSTAYSPETIVATYNVPMPEPAGAEVLAVRQGDIPVAREVAAKVASRAGLPDDRVADVALVANELVTNSVEHGGGSGTLRVWPTETAVVCEINDTGRLTDPLAGRLPAAPAQLRGRGLLMVNQLADLVRMHTDAHGTTIRAYFNCPAGT